MINALEFTAHVVDMGVLEKIVQRSKETGERKVDFTGTSILEHVHIKIAEAIINEGMIPINIPESSDVDKIEYFRIELSQPQVENINEFKKVFKKGSGKVLFVYWIEP